MCARYRRNIGVVKQTLSRFVGDEGGATAIEYGLIAGIVALAIVSAVVSMGGSVSSILSDLSSDLEAVIASGGPGEPGGPGGPGEAGRAAGPGQQELSNHVIRAAFTSLEEERYG